MVFSILRFRHFKELIRLSAEVLGLLWIPIGFCRFSLTQGVLVRVVEAPNLNLLLLGVRCSGWRDRFSRGCRSLRGRSLWGRGSFGSGSRCFLWWGFSQRGLSLLRGSLHDALNTTSQAAKH
jgi:hypothetical protein